MCTQPVQQQLGGHGSAFARVPRRYPISSLAESTFLALFLVPFAFFHLNIVFFLNLFASGCFTDLVVNGTPRGARYPGVCLSRCSHHGVKLKVGDTECPLQVCQLSRPSESTHFRSFVEM